MGFFLGIDGGGSKTECVLADEAGAVLARAAGGGTNLRRAQAAELRATLGACLQRLQQTAGLRVLQPEAVCAGFAGAGETQARAKACDVLTELLHPPHLYVVGDMEVALEAAVGAGRGVVLVAGTGAIAYGRNDQGRQARAGGRGPFPSGDEGSGFDIGCRAVEAAQRAQEVGGETTRLSESVREGLRQRGIEKLEGCVTPESVAEVAALVPRVVEAAHGGDEAARAILEQAAAALASLAVAALRELELLQAEVSVATTGGVFTQSEEVFARVRERIQRAAPRARVEPLAVAPAEGAVRLAQRLWLQEQGVARD